MNAWNSKADSSGEYESRISLAGTNEPEALSEVLSVLSHRTSRHILYHLLQQDEGLSVERLATRIAEERTQSATDSVVSGAERNDKDSSS